MAIQYVGGRGAGRAGATSTVNVPINSGLTGGIGAAAIAGDLVVVTVAVGTQARTPSCAISGYTALTQQNVTPTTYDTSVCTSYKIMPGTPDTQVTIPSTGNIADGQGYRIMVFRGVDSTTPLDGVTPTYATGSGVNNRPDGAAITPATAGAWIVVGGGGAASAGTTLFTASELSGFVSYNGPDTNDGTVGMGYYSGWSSGSWNPAGWLGGSVNAANSWGCTTLVLRAAPEPPETYEVSILEGVKFGDSDTPVATYFTGAQDGVRLGDLLIPAAEFYTIAADGIKLGDLISAELTRFVSIVDGLKLGDSARAESTYYILTADGIKLGDKAIDDHFEIEKKTGVGGEWAEFAGDLLPEARTTDDTSGFANGITYYYRIRFVVDEVPGDWSNEVGVTYVGGNIYEVTSADGVKLGDFDSGAATFFPIAADGLRLGDGDTPLTTYSIITADGLKLGDLISAEAEKFVNVTDGLKLGDMNDVIGTYFVASVDGINLGDAAASLYEYFARVADGLKLGDLIDADVSGAWEALARDGIKLGDSAQMSAEWMARSADEIKFGDNSSVVMTWQVGAIDGAKFGDIARGIATMFTSLTDGVKFEDITNGTVSIIITTRFVNKNTSLHFVIRPAIPRKGLKFH